MTEQGNNFALYVSGLTKMKITFPEGGLTEDAKSCIKDTLYESHSLNNNLAYLLRRNEIESITIDSPSAKAILPEELLADGIRTYEEFSVINYALSISGIHHNEKGDYSIGKEYLMSVKDALVSSDKYWSSVIDWWGGLLKNHNEYEGLVVLTWLFVLGIVEPADLSQSLIEKASEMLANTDKKNSDFSRFKKAIHNLIDP
jgi:hypothetical protein